MDDAQLRLEAFIWL